MSERPVAALHAKLAWTNFFQLLRLVLRTQPRSD